MINKSTAPLIHPALKKYLADKINIPPADEHLIGSLFKPLTAKRNEILIAQGSVASTIYFIVSGCLRIFMKDREENEATRFFAFENEFATAFPSFILQEPSSAAVQCAEPCELLALDYADRQLLIRDVPGWEGMTMKALEEDYIVALQRIESFVSMNSKARYDHLLKNTPQIVKRLPAKIVAEYLGISQETLSRLKAKDKKR